MPQDGGLPLPAAPPNAPGFPQSYIIYPLDGFETLNTKPSRPGIGDQEMYICQNFQPLGRNNLRTMWDVGATLYAAGGGNTISWIAFANIGSAYYCLAFLSDGSCTAINTQTGVTTSLATSGTFTSMPPAVSQWGNQYIIIATGQTNGYWIWDGTSLYSAGTIGPIITITNSGNGYTSSPTVSVTNGSGTGVTLTPVIQDGALVSLTVATPGSGYVVGDTPVINFAGGGSGTNAIATATVSSGTVSAISLSNHGSGYTSAPSVTLLGGFGSGATATATVSSGTVSAISISAHGSGYTEAPSVLFSGGGNSVATATLVLMPFGVMGTAIETFSSRVWIANGNQVFFTAPGAISDFSTSDGGGLIQSSDSFLRNTWQNLKQSNGFLYLVADSSVNYISGVTTSGSPPTTTFTNQNVDPQVGTPWPWTVQVFSRAVVFANYAGVHAMYGGAVEKVSPQLDGIFAAAPFNNNISLGGFVPSAAVAILNGVQCYVVLLPIVDQITGVQTNEMLLWDGRRWWNATQTPSLVQIATQEINSNLIAWGTDGNSIYPLFNTPSSITKTVQSKYWTKPHYMYRKHADRTWVLCDNTGYAITLTVNVDSENGAQQAIVTALTPVQWFNNSAVLVTWENKNGNIVTWVSSSDIPQLSAFDVNGELLGLTIQSQSDDFILVGATLGAQIYQLNI